MLPGLGTERERERARDKKKRDACSENPSTPAGQIEMHVLFHNLRTPIMSMYNAMVGKVII